MAGTQKKIRDARVWMQFGKFQRYKLILIGGMTDLTDTVGAINPSRSPSRTTHGEEVIDDILRGSPGLPGFSLTTRLKKTKNYLLGIKCMVNAQGHVGACARADDYYSAEMIAMYADGYRGDITIPTLSQIEGDNAKIEYTVPFSAVWGLSWLDMNKYFLSARTITETADVTDMAFLGHECFENCMNQEDAGANGYAVFDAYAGSPGDVADVWYTIDKGNTWARCSATPFLAGETVSAVLVAGIVDNHRVIVFRGTTDAGNPAECAYAEVTTMGTTAWNYVNIGSVIGQYINYAFYLDDQHIYAVTNDGYVYVSEDGGASWTAQFTTGIVGFNDVSALPDGTIWVGGDTNTLYLSTDEGDSYTAVTGPSSVNIRSLTVTPDGTVYVGDSAGNVWGSYNQGSDWTSMPLQGATCTDVRRIRHTPVGMPNDVLFIVGNLADGSGRCWFSPDGGATWRLWSLNMPANSGLTALVPIDENMIFVGGNAHPAAGTAFITRTSTNLIGL